MRNTMIIILATILSLCASCQLELAEAPTIVPSSESVEYGTTIEIATQAKRAAIRYTLDGTDPTYESTLYESAISIVKNTILKAAAFKGKKIVSAIASFEYNVKSPKPTSDVVAGTYATAKTVTLSCSSTEASIYYTIDGSDPKTNGTLYTSSLDITYATCLPQTKLRIVAKLDDCEYSDVAEYDYLITGPAGGIVFYDCDADNDSGNADGLKSSECGWRYIEAATADISVEGSTSILFGQYRQSDDGPVLYVNGTETYDAATCTGKAIGTGKSNTQKLVSAFGDEAYVSHKTADITKTSNYAAKLCVEYTQGGFNDWFLPSKDELNLLYTTLKMNSLGGFANDIYWSSSEQENSIAINQAWGLVFSDGGIGYRFRGYGSRVRAIRTFQVTED